LYHNILWASPDRSGTQKPLGNQIPPSLPLCTEAVFRRKHLHLWFLVPTTYDEGRASKLRRKVKSVGMTVPVDAHERTRDYLTEDEFLTLLEGTKGARYRWRDSAMLMLTFYHGLRASEVCHLRRQDVDLTHGRIWIARLKGSLSTEQPLLPQELRQRPVSEINQQA
jgi:integrase